MATIITKSDIPSILSKTVHVRGEINSNGILEIEGKTQGLIKGNLVIIREGGYVEGRIEAEHLNIHGNFNGEIKANNISIYKKAKVLGNIEYKSLCVEDGASIDGKFKKFSNVVVEVNENLDSVNAAEKIANENKSKFKVKAL